MSTDNKSQQRIGHLEEDEEEAVDPVEELYPGQLSHSERVFSFFRPSPPIPVLLFIFQKVFDLSNCRLYFCVQYSAGSILCYKFSRDFTVSR